VFTPGTPCRSWLVFGGRPSGILYLPVRRFNSSRPDLFQRYPNLVLHGLPTT